MKSRMVSTNSLGMTIGFHDQRLYLQILFHIEEARGIVEASRFGTFAMSAQTLDTSLRLTVV